MALGNYYCPSCCIWYYGTSCPNCSSKGFVSGVASVSSVGYSSGNNEQCSHCGQIIRDSRNAYYQYTAASNITTLTFCLVCAIKLCYTQSPCVICQVNNVNNINLGGGLNQRPVCQSCWQNLGTAAGTPTTSNPQAKISTITELRRLVQEFETKVSLYKKEIISSDSDVILKALLLSLSTSGIGLGAKINRKIFEQLFHKDYEIIIDMESDEQYVKVILKEV